MSTLTRLKIVLAGVGALLFGAGVRTDLGWLRGAGILLVAVAWVLRFVRPKEDAPQSAAE